MNVLKILNEGRARDLMGDFRYIIISGTPGTGKTTVARGLGDRLGAEVISLNELVMEEGLVEGYDEARDTYIVDFDHLVPRVVELIKDTEKTGVKRIIIEGHFADVIPEEYIDVVFILRCHPDELKRRLEARGYGKEKVRENVEAEILGDCIQYMLEKALDVPILEIDTSNMEVEALIELILEILEGKRDYREHELGTIDWLGLIDEEGRLSEFFQ